MSDGLSDVYRDRFDEPNIIKYVKMCGLKNCAHSGCVVEVAELASEASDDSPAGGEEPQRGEKGHICDNPDCSQCWGPSARSRD